MVRVRLELLLNFLFALVSEALGLGAFGWCDGPDGANWLSALVQRP